MSQERVLSADAMRPTPAPLIGWVVSPSAAARAVQTQAMVLVVSRSASVREEFRAALTVPGFRVIEAATVADAVALTHEVVVHLAVGDAGAAALTRDLPWLPTVFVAGLDDVAPPVTGTRAQMLVRPLVPERLHEIVRLLLER